jgi:hypothetical protein
MMTCSGYSVSMMILRKESLVWEKGKWKLQLCLLLILTMRMMSRKMILRSWRTGNVLKISLPCHLQYFLMPCSLFCVVWWRILTGFTHGTCLDKFKMQVLTIGWYKHFSKRVFWRNKKSWGYTFACVDVHSLDFFSFTTCHCLVLFSC